MHKPVAAPLPAAPIFDLFSTLQELQHAEVALEDGDTWIAERHLTIALERVASHRRGRFVACFPLNASAAHQLEFNPDRQYPQPRTLATDLAEDR